MKMQVSPLTIQFVSMPLGFVSTQASLIFRSTRLVKLPFFHKAAAVIVHIHKLQGTRERVYARDQLNT